ncbi:MAG: helix-turn-helix domain-containing protein [Candidatus Marinimicrobia bacterium]|nr:helix-turn-helix domain-containing protein [Candidatus Neomarinimicrobiota bacterium]MDD5539149.1 helix-turn-helix domain-containing protein [Candidatus Neomarinimicrobiota bacterium]
MDKKPQVKITVDAADITTCYKAAEILGVHYVTIYRLVKRGVLHSIPIGDQTYLSIKEVEKLKEDREKKQKTEIDEE